MQLPRLPFTPEQASTVSTEVDALYTYLVAITLFFSVLVTVLILYFAVKYRRRSENELPHPIAGSVKLETMWTVIPFLISMTIFVWGASLYFKLYRPPKDAIEIFVVGKQWMWKFQHGSGQREINELHIPVGRNIKLTMTTEDVLHDLYVPAFRTKMDVIPGRYTTLWFNATKPGKYHLFCAEYCGLNHSGMGGWVYVMEQRDFDNWLSGNVSGQTPVQAGQDLFQNKLGCATCHQGGQNQRGAQLEGVYGTDVKLTNGQTVKADDEYIRNSILNPGGQIVEGYQPIMPTFKGQVTEEQLVSLVAYIKSLSGSNGGTGSSSTNSGSTMNSTSSGREMMNNGGTNSTNLVAPRADRGDSNSQGSNPNAPKIQSEPTNRER